LLNNCPYEKNRFLIHSSIEGEYFTAKVNAKKLTTVKAATTNMTGFFKVIQLCSQKPFLAIVIGLF
jgi:hypothetical protein